MRKDILKVAIISATVGAIVAGGATGVVAYGIGSNQVGFTPTDSAWKVNSVNEAIDDLYIKKTGDNYSTEERVVGTWIDGKPIYQKSYTVLTKIKIDSSTGKSVDGVTDNYITDIKPTLDRLIGIEVRGNTNDDWAPNYPITFRPTSGKFSQYDNPGVSYLSYWLYKDAIITFQYTKTTDIVPTENNEG